MLGSLLSAGADLLAGHLNNQANQRRQEDAQTFSAQQFATRYQTTVADMKAAGLNPMLAYTQGGGNAPSGTAASGGDYGRPGTSFNQARLNSAQAASVEAGIDNVRAQTDQIKADTALKRAQMLKEESMIPFYGASADEARSRIGLQENQVRQIVEQVKNIPVEGERLRAAVKLLGKQADLVQNQAVTEEQKAQQVFHLVRKTLLEADLLAFDKQAAESLDNIGRESQQLKPIVEMIKMLLSTRR